jgi:hypothetical protein
MNLLEKVFVLERTSNQVTAKVRRDIRSCFTRSCESIGVVLHGHDRILCPQLQLSLVGTLFCDGQNQRYLKKIVSLRALEVYFSRLGGSYTVDGKNEK